MSSLRAIAEPVVEAHGLDLVAIELVHAPETVLRVSVDKPGGATIQDCTRVSRQLSPELDTADLIQVAYALEVSTPGIERPLQREKDFVYFTGCTARLKLYGVDGRRRLTGVLAGVDAGILKLRLEAETRAIPLTDVERANLVLDLDQYARLGEGLHPIEHEGSP